MIPQTRLPVGFAGVDLPAGRPRPRSAPRPAALALGVETLPGVGGAVRKRLAGLGLRTELVLASAWAWGMGAGLFGITAWRWWGIALAHAWRERR